MNRGMTTSEVAAELGRLRRQVAALTAERDAAKSEAAFLLAKLQDVTAYEYDRLKAWIVDPQRKPSGTAFTAGSLRTSALAIEDSGVLATLARVASLTAERDRLRGAIRSAGFSIMETSGDWSIHDVSKLAKAEEKRTAEVIAENIDLQVDRDTFAATLASLAEEWRQRAEQVKQGATDFSEGRVLELVACASSLESLLRRSNE